MRKALIAVAVATALFAVGAFAASFAVQSEDVASGGNAVTACAPLVDIDFDQPVADSAGNWTVDGATARFYSAGGPTPTLATACDGFAARLAILAPGVQEFASTGDVSNGAVSFDFGTGYAVSAITSASVVVDGETLTADIPVP